MTHAKEVLEAVKERGYIEVRSGVYLSTQEYMMAEHKNFSDYDEAKDMDFSDSPYWITTDDGCTPEGIRDEKDLEQYL